MSDVYMPISFPLSALRTLNSFVSGIATHYWVNSKSFSFTPGRSHISIPGPSAPLPKSSAVTTIPYSPGAQNAHLIIARVVLMRWRVYHAIKVEFRFAHVNMGSVSH